MIVLLIGYMWIFIHRPFEIWHSLRIITSERIYILVCAVLWLFFHKKSTIRNINIHAIISITVAILISDYMTNTTELMNGTVEEWLKILFFLILLITSVRSEMELKVILTSFSVIFFVYMLHSYYEFKFCGRVVYSMGIPRLCGIGATLNDPNSFGASIVYYLPVLVPLWMLVRGVPAIPIRLFCIGSFCLSVICISDTGSRGSFIGLISYVILAAAFSKNRWKILTVAVVVFPILWASMDQRIQDRYLTIIDPSRQSASAKASTEGRIGGFKWGMALFQNSPIYGVGPGKSADYIPSGLQTHNFLGQVAGELGGIGLVTYGFLCFCITINYLFSRFYWKILSKHCPNADSYPFQVSQAVFIAMILLLILGLGSHNAYRYTWVWYAVFQSMAVVALKKKTEDVISEQIKSNMTASTPAHVQEQIDSDIPVPQPV